MTPIVIVISLPAACLILVALVAAALLIRTRT
jgi:hypothetical protein